MKFEQAGRVIDREVGKLVRYLDREVKPATRQEMADLLRTASRELGRLAKKLEKGKS